MAKRNTDAMSIDLTGRVNSIKLADRSMLLPLFEAIVNSIHAIEDAKIPNGKITITLERDSLLSCDESNGFYIPCIHSFLIEDNGVGFDKNNYQSFKRAYSTYKASRGGKGLGRFTWLKAFSDVSIDSVFYENHLPYKKTFQFNLKSDSGIQNLEESQIEGKPQKRTIVKLSGYKDPYKSKCPKKIETIANRIIEHCLVYFSSASCPEIIIVDGATTININKRFVDLTAGNSYTGKFILREFEFKLTLLKWFEHDELTYHKISLCANNREVEDFNISKIFPDIQGKINDSETQKDYLIVGYLESEYFDANVNGERTEIAFAKGGLYDDALINKNDIFSAVTPIVEDQFKQVVDDFKQKKLDRINQFIAEKAPQYRILTSKEGSLDNIVITDTMSEQDIDLKLYRVYQDIDFESRNDVVRIIKSMDNGEESPDSLKEKYTKIIHTISEINKTKLAQYIIHRKYIIDLLEKSLGWNEDGKYEKEQTVHDIIFPTRTNSDEIQYEDQNLWLIDERLSFHTFLSSDKPLNSIPSLDTKSIDRPDIAIFNNPLMFTEGEELKLNSVVLIEFKRPMRNQYDPAKDNPIEQVYDYVTAIRSGKQLTKNGRKYNIDDNTIFYTYVVCDINEKIERSASYATLSRTADGLGFYGYNKDLRCMIEILTFDQILHNSKQRNRILFTKLGIH